MAVRVLLGLGGNVGDTKKYLLETVEMINERVGLVLVASKFYQSEAWGFEAEQAFINQSIIVETELSPKKTLEVCLGVEAELGRERKNGNVGYKSRPIDIDILFWGNDVMNEIDLIVPHPLMQERMFVLKPSAEIAAGWEHPVLKKTLSELVKQCGDCSKVEEV